MKTAMMTGLMVAVGLAGCANVGGGVGARRSLVRVEPSCQEITAPIYFESNQAVLTRESRRVITMAAAGARGCSVDAVQVLGLADASGEAAANLDLSRRRAAAVGDALVRAKLPPAQFVDGAGQAGAVTKAGQMQPVRRRADVILKLSKPKA